MKNIERFNIINLLMMFFGKDNILIYIEGSGARIRHGLYLNIYLLRGGNTLKIRKQAKLP